MANHKKESNPPLEGSTEISKSRYFWFNWVLHPFLFALYIVLALLAYNVRELPLSDAYRSLLVAVAGTAVLLIFLRFIFRDWQRAALVTSLILFLTASYGHVYNLLESSSFAGVLLGRHRYLITAWILALILGTWVAIKIKNPQTITQLLNLVAVAALILPLITIGGYIIRAHTLPNTVATASTEQDSFLKVPENSQPPDIYYIVLDAYAREDILQNDFGFDNSEFLNALRTRGFYVADQSNSNYLRTIFSITSAMNSDYLTNLDIDLNHTEHRLLSAERLRDSWVRRQLEGTGYTTVALTSSYPLTEITDADYYIIPNMVNIEALRARGAYNEFEGLIIHNSIAFILLEINSLRQSSVKSFVFNRLDNARDIRREIILSSFDHLAEIPNISGPKFVFSHIISPHSPYLFGPNGEHVNYPRPVTLSERYVSPGSESWEQYRDQLQYINTKIIETIDAIMASSDETPIIILQSDHGPPTGDWEDPNQLYIIDRKAILNAYYLPAECQDQLYPNISPVNSFRVVFNCVFGTSFQIQEDKAYLDGLDQNKGLLLIPLDD